ncbi:MAG: hypothetical protein WDN04_17060 [Rhodospirillales bacterium]
MSNLQLHRKHSLLSVARRAARTGARNGAARLRGVAVLQMAVAAALTVGGFSSAIAKNRPFTLLYTFTGGNDGGYPFAGLLADNAGNLYGTAEGFGRLWRRTVFKLAPNGTETTLYTFGTGGGADAQYPQAGLIADKAGQPLRRDAVWWRQTMMAPFSKSRRTARRRCCMPSRTKPMAPQPLGAA